MSEYQISSVYFSRRNKLLLLICVFFFSCSTHVFKNVFPFLFMLTGVRNEIDLDNVANQAGRFPSRGGPLGGAAKGGGIQTDLFGQSAAYSLGRTPPTIVSEEATHSSTYLETKGRNSQSIYLYSNILTLIYCSSLVTYIFILVYDLGKKNYVINSFYIINLVAHFTIFLLLSDIQMRNTDLREVMSWRDGSLSRDAMPLFGRYPAEDMLAKRRDINFYFKRNLRDRLDAGEFLSVGLFQRSALEFVLGGVEAGGRFEAGEDKTSSDMGKDNRDGEQRNSDMGKDNRDGEQRNSDVGKDNRDGEQRNSDVGKDNRDTGRDNRSREEAYTYERKHLKFLYLCIIISSICSGYIKIYQKRIMYCIFYVNIGVITSLLILMNSLFKLFAHSLNYVVTNNNSITDISDYIILFLVIDMFGLLTILIFTYKWFYQRKLWVNLHTIFYNYKYVCFYHKETYYLYSVDKQIDSILVHIDMCGDENIKISFCAYMNLNKSIFYDYLRLNTFRKNKLRILEIADQSLHVTSTYKAVERPHGEHGEHSERGEVDQRGQRDEGGEVDQHGERGEGGTPSFGRKQKHSYTMKPYKICIESLSSLANVGPDEQLAEGQLRGEEAQGQPQMYAPDRDEGNEQKGRGAKIPSCVKKQGRRLAKGDSVHFQDQPGGEPKELKGVKGAKGADEGVEADEEDVANGENAANEEDVANEEDASNEESAANYAMLGGEERVDAREGEEQKRNVLLIPNYDDECSRNADYYDDWELSDERDDGDDAGTSFLSRADERNSQVGNKLLSIYQGINKFCSSFTFYFFFFIFIYAFLLSIMHIFINYFFYIYLFVFNINIYVSNVYTIIMTFVSLIAIPFSGYIVDNIGSFLSLLLCSSSFILVAISGSIYCYKLNQNSEALAFLFFNLIGISESIIPTVIISQIPTHLCVKNNESITSAFAIFELVTMIIISLNNYVFGCFLIKEEYLKGLYVLFFFVILVIVLILLLIVTIYLKKKRSARAYKSPRNADLAQPLL
ncbi:unnamed protein product [Plasmodium vivax]|uniref:(malaria parasite P. vivax) hypothetical protein n=1 Tax=Plasmodium vivax TaxID=5855 RepID=A0A8S4H9H5_PLAVI|nr:unnamed protein product [Plasmodium vivax]